MKFNCFPYPFPGRRFERLYTHSLLFVLAAPANLKIKPIKRRKNSTVGEMSMKLKRKSPAKTFKATQKRIFWTAAAAELQKRQPKKVSG